MNNAITANELKVKGVSALEAIVSQGMEALITVRGKTTYVVVSSEEYDRLRNYELTAALLESQDDIKAGRFHEDSVKNHLKRLENA